ncbi:MAG: response regulator [Syntrophobacteraceae bacterium]
MESVSDLLSEARAQRSTSRGLFEWASEVLLPLALLIAIGIAWYIAAEYRKSLETALTNSYQETQLEIVRAVARSSAHFVEEALRDGKQIQEVEQQLFKKFVAPVHLLSSGDAWIYAPTHVVFDLSTDFPESYRGKSMAEIFAIQASQGASHYETMTSNVMNAREGVGWYIWLPEKGKEVASWTPIQVGEHTWTIGLSTPLREILQATGADKQSALVVMLLTTATMMVIILTVTALWSTKHRRHLDSQLLQSNTDLQTLVKDLREEVERRKLTEEALQEVNGRLNTLIEAIPDAITFKDTEGRHLIVNRAFEALASEDLESAVGKTDLDLFPTELAMQSRKSDDLVIRNRCLLQTSETFMGADGETLYFETNRAPLFGKDGLVVGIVGVSRNITDHKRAELEKERLIEQLMHAQKMEAVGLLAGGVAHDLNNILTGLVTYPEVLLKALPEDSRLRKPLTTIQSSGEKAAGIVQDLLTLSRRGVSHHHVTDLNHLVKEYLQSSAHQKLMADHPRITEAVELADDLLFIKGSTVQLSKSIGNLVINAVEAIADGGTLRIRTKNCYVDDRLEGTTDVAQGEYVRLTVSDTGAAIGQEDLSRIFEPFYIRKVMGRKGTGLGLAVVWGTIQDHNGFVNVKSQEGEGTTFELYFPVTREKAVRELEPIVGQEMMGKGESLLVVDDIEDQREIASEMLSLLGYRVTVAASGEEAVAHVRKHPVDLVVLDMIMTPGMDGLETYRELIKLKPGLKAVITSGYSETDRVKEAQRLGAGSYIRKPYLMEAIGKAIREALDQ